MKTSSLLFYFFRYALKSGVSEQTKVINYPKTSLKVEMECPECHSKNLVWDYKRGECYCENCGLVIEDAIIDTRPEWRYFTQEERRERERCGAPETYRIHDKGLSTPPCMLKHRTIAHLTSSEESRMIYALTELERISSALGVPTFLREEAAKMLREILSSKETEKKLTYIGADSIVPSVIYIVCRRNGIPRSLNDIVKVSKVPKRRISHTYRSILRALNIQLRPPSPSDFIPVICSTLGLSGDVCAIAQHILSTAKDVIGGKNPLGVAASAIYVAAFLCGKHVTQKEVAEAAGVSEVSIRNIYRDLIKEHNITIVPKQRRVIVHG